MEAKEYNDLLAQLRTLRDEIKPLQRSISKLEGQRDTILSKAAQYQNAQAPRMATSAGMTIADVAALTGLGNAEVTSQRQPEPEPDNAGSLQSTCQGALAPPLRPTGRKSDPAEAPAPETPAATAQSDDHSGVPVAPVLPSMAPAKTSTFTSEAPTSRALPSIPEGEPGDNWLTPTPKLFTTHPNFVQTPRQMAFLDATTGVLVHKDGPAVRLELGSGSAAEIISAVYASVPATIERIYITAGAPWLRAADQYPYLVDAVSAWLNAPVPGWKVEATRGKERDAGHFVHARHPVGRWQRGDQHTEIRAVSEWFDTEGADPTVVREAFVLVWRHLQHQWPNEGVLMGSPSQTGRDLWARTIPTKSNTKWPDGYPVLSEEIRGLLHATAGQGRNEIIAPPRVPDQLPRVTELDRTFAYAKHCWSGGIGTPRRMTAAGFASLSEEDQINALYAPSHWQVRVTVPAGWDHVGILPAPAPGDRAWYYPHAPGQTFTTWAGGAEITLALRNPISPWKVEILDGLVWDAGAPLREWSTKLREAWSSLRAQSKIHGDLRVRMAAHLASRAVRSILLYAIGGFAQRPRTTTGVVPVGSEAEIPSRAVIIGNDGRHYTWRLEEGFTRNPNAQPQLAAGVWSAARAALLSTRMREDNVSVGALHLPAGSVLAFRTDAIYTSAPDVQWPYHDEPGDYLVKGYIPNPIAAPTNEEEFLAMQAAGREHMKGHAAAVLPR